MIELLKFYLIIQLFKNDLDTSILKSTSLLFASLQQLLRLCVWFLVDCISIYHFCKPFYAPALIHYNFTFSPLRSPINYVYIPLMNTILNGNIKFISSIFFQLHEVLVINGNLHVSGVLSFTSMFIFL